MNFKSTLLSILLLSFLNFVAAAQNLVISTAGQTGTSGTNWSITGNTLNVAASGTANIHPDVISNHLNNVGDLTVILPWQSGQIRQCSIDGSITYTGSATRTLTFLIANDIFITTPNQSISATGSGALNVVLRAANSSGHSGRISIRQNNTINTNGGHLWIGGGSGNATWNGLTVGDHYARTYSADIPGLWIENATLNTNGGNLEMKGFSHYSGSTASTFSSGILFEGSSISTAEGSMVINGSLNGNFGTGIATFIRQSDTNGTNVSTTSGSITITGVGTSTSNPGWRHGIVVGGQVARPTFISTVSGNISVHGTANYNGFNDQSGIQLQGDDTRIVSRTGNITLKGTNPYPNLGHFSNAIRFQNDNVTNAVRIGYDGTNTYSGNIIIEGNSIGQRTNQTGSGSISIQTTGDLTIQPEGTAFTHLRAGDSGTLTFDDDWNFGTNLGSFTFGKTTNNLNISFSNDIALNGSFTVYGSNIGIPSINANGNVYIRSTSYIDQGGTKTTSTGGGNVVYWAGSSGESYIRPGTITTNGGHVYMGGDYDSPGTRTWRGLTVGGGYAYSAANAGIALRGNIDTRVTNNQTIGGDVLLAGESGQSGLGDVCSEGSNRTISVGNGNITLLPFSEMLQSNGALQMILNTTGKISIAPASSKSFFSGSTLNYSGSLTGTTFNGSSALAGIQIPNFANITGWELGTWSGTQVVGDNAYVEGNVKDMTLTASFSLAGPIRVVGGNIVLNNNLNSTAENSAILLKATRSIVLATNTSIQTNNGDITFWANSDGTANATDGDFIGFNSGVVLNTANGSTTQLTGGGTITLGGGTTSATLSSGTVVPTGYAYSNRTTNWGSTKPSGVQLGAFTHNHSGSTYPNDIKLYSGGGNIVIKGNSNSDVPGISWFGGASGSQIIDSGEGTVTIDGKGDAGHGIEFSFFPSAVSPNITSSSNAETAITINGTSLSTGGYAGYQGTSTIISKGSGGIAFNGKTSATAYKALEAGTLNVYAASGPITFQGEGGTGVAIGGTWGKGTLASSSSNITIRSNQLSFSSGTTATTSGTVTIEPFGSSFSSELTFPITNLSLANTVSGLTLGKSSNTANITFGAATTIAGPITAYGGSIAINANLTSSATTGTGISLIGKKIIQSGGIAVTTSGANIDYLASDFSTTSAAEDAIKIGATSGARASINAGGGNVSLTGSFGTTSVAGGNDYGLWLFGTDVITSGTGMITLTGDATNTLSTASAYGITMGNATIKTQSGAITLNGTGGKASGNSRGIVADTFSNKIISVSGPITLNEKKPTALTGTYNGLFMKPASTTNTFFGADGTDVASSSSSVTITGDRASFDVNSTFRNNINTSGAIVFESVANSFETDPSLSGLTISGNPSSVQIGKTTNTANITLGSAVSAAGPIDIYGGNITINENLNTTAGDADGDILLQGTANIIQAASKTITTNGGDVTFWADKDGNGSGYVRLNSSSSISTSGGNITLGGGTDITSGYARGASVVDGSVTGGTLYVSGVHLNSAASLSSGGGNITLRGQNEGTTNVSSLQFGVWSQNATVNSGTGKIAIYGLAGGTGLINAQGISSDGGWTIRSSNTESDAIRLEGDASLYNGSTTSLGINFAGTIEATGQDGGVYMLGKSGTSTGYDQALDIYGNILASSGPIEIVGENNVSTQTGLFLGGGATIGFKSGTNVTSSSSNITLKSDNTVFNAATPINTSGTVSLLPLDASNSFAVAQSLGANLNLNSSVSGFTVGKTTNTSDITFGAATTIAGPISVYGGDVTINENLNTTTGAASGDILLKASGNITLAASKSITTDGGEVVFWSDSDLNNAGSIAFSGGGHAITTNGGDVIIGGGAGTTIPTGVASGASLTHGVFVAATGTSSVINTRKQNATGGNVIIRGKTTGNFDGVYLKHVQIFAENLTIEGETPSAVSTNFGVSFHSDIVYDGTNLSTVINVDNDLTISAINTASSYSGNSIRTGANPRFFVAGNTTINSSGKLNFTSQQSFLTINPGKTLAVNFDGTANFTTSLGDPNTGISQGSLMIQSFNQPSFTSAFNTSTWSFNSNLSGLTIGKSTNNSAVTLANATSIAGPITLYGGDLAINAVTTATSSDINLHATGAVTQTAALTANRLALNGAGTFTLNNTSNNIATLAGGSDAAKLGSLSFTDASGGLTIGTVNPTGVYSTGAILIETLEGDITISENIKTENTSSNAIIINAGKSAAIGTVTGGDIKISGIPSITTGVNGIAKFFSGSESASTGLSNLVGASNVRKLVDESTTTFNPALEGNNKYALYRQSLPLDISIVSSGGAAKGSGWNVVNGVLTVTTSVSIDAAAIQAELASGTLVIQSNGTISIDGALSYTGTNALTFEAPNLAFNAAVSSLGNIILKSDVSITQTGSGSISTPKLAVIGTADVTLNNLNNDLGTVALGDNTNKTGTINIVNKTSLTVGTVNPTGITSSGLIELATMSGDLLITEPLVSTLATGDAIKLYADKDAAAGAAGDGNIKISGNGSITVEAGARALLYSGTESLSTGVTDAVGGQSNTRSNVGATTDLATLSPSVESTGKYALYRVVPPLSKNANLASLTVSTGTLTPVFDAATLVYDVLVPAATSSYNFTPTLSDAGATLKINEVSHTSGTAYSTTLTANTTTFKITVTSEDGTVTRNYTLRVLRQVTTVPAPAGNWVKLFYGDRFDPNDDQQATADTDIVGNIDNPLMQAQQAMVNIGGTLQKVYYFRVRLANAIRNNGASPSTSFYYGFDITNDQKINFFVEANVKASTPVVAYHIGDPRKDGSGPSQTAWMNSSTNINVERPLNAANSRIIYYPVTLETGVTTNVDLDAPVGGSNTGNDTWLEFAFTESSFTSFTNDAYGTPKKGSDVFGLVAFTSTSQTANGDIGGINDKTANLNQTWAELGVILTTSLDAVTDDEVNDPLTVQVISTKSINGDASVYGVWNGEDYPNALLTVTVYEQDGVTVKDTFVYNNVTATSTGAISTTGFSWYIDVTNYLPGLYPIKAVMSDGSASPTSDEDAGTLLITRIKIDELLTDDTTPTFTGVTDQAAGATVVIEIKDDQGNVIRNYTTQTLPDGSWSFTIPDNDPLPIGDYDLYAEITVENSLSFDEVKVRIVESPQIEINSNLEQTYGSAVLSGISDQPADTDVDLVLTAEDGTEYKFTVKTDANGNWSFDLSTLPAGDYQVYVSLEDSNGLRVADQGVLVIKKKDLTLTGFTVDNKVYDGNTVATVTGSPSILGVEGTDDVSLTGTAVYTFADKNVANDIEVTLSGLSISGTNSGNYNLVLPTTLKANITKASLTITVEDKSKVFGASDPTLTVKYETFVNNETASVLSGTLSISRVAGESVGTYVITASGLTSDNYEITFVDGEFSITAKAISNADVTVEAIEDLVYNGQNQMPKPVVKDGTITLVEGIDYELEYSENKNAGTATITITGIDNYSGSTTVTFNITKASLTITAEDKTKVFGASDPTLTVKYETFVNNETASVLSGTLSISREAGESVNTYDITASGLTSDNYEITFVKGEFSITAKAISNEDITVEAIEDLVYNGQNQMPKPVVKDGTVTLLEGTDYELEYSENKDAGTATITITGIGNYSGSTTVTFKITKASLTITAEDKTKIFGASDPTLTVKYETFVNNETASVLSGTLSISRVAGESVGTYVITASGLTSDNYNISFVDGEFSITAKTISDGDVTVEAIGDLVYNGQDQTPKPVVKDGTVTLEEGIDYELEYSENKDAGTATITIKGIGNYSGERTVTFKITKASLTITAEDKTKIFGASDPTLTVKYETFVNNETASVLSGTLSISRVAGESVGTYVITASGLTSNNYNISFVDGEFSITAKTISDGDVTVEAIGDLVYNGQDQTPKPVVKDGTVTLEEGIDYELEYSENKDAGTATITIKGIGNYSGERTVTFKITKASLTITAEDKTKIFGASDPTLTVKYETFVNNETASVLSGTLSISRVAGESVGTYVITASGLTSNNYDIVFVDGEFSITAKTISDGDVTVEAIGDLVYNGQDQTPKPVVKDGTVTLEEGIDYELEYSENKDAGTATITIKGIGNYRGSRTVTFKITPRTLVVSPDGGLTKKYGETDPVLSYTYQNNVSGETPGFTGSLTRNAGEQVGNYEMTRGSLGLVDNGAFKASNYVIELTEDVDFTITKAMLTVRVNDDSKFVTQSDATGYAGVIYTGFKFGENKSVIDESNLVISRTNVGVEAADEYPNVLTATGLLAQNYEFTYDLGDYVIVGADQLLVKLGDREVVYGATPTYGVVYAGYYSSEVNEIVNLTSNSTITNGRVKVVDGVSGSAEFDVTVQSPVNSSSGRLVVDSYKLGGTNIVETSANFKNTVLIQGNLTVIAKELTGGVSSVTDKVYDGNAQLLDLNLTLSTPFAIDVVVLNGTGTYASKDVGTHSYTVSGLTLSGIDSKNYYVSGGASATLTGTGKITVRTLTVTPRSGLNKVFGTVDPILSYLVTGNVSGETAGFTGVLSRAVGEAIGTYEIFLGDLELSDNGSFLAGNYELEFVDGLRFAITAKTISDGDVTVEAIGDLEYNGLDQTPKPVVKDGTVTLEEGIDYELEYSENKDAGTATITIKGIGNYSGERTVTFKITKASLTITAEDKTKIFGASDPTLTVKYETFVNNETASVLSGTLSISRVAGESVGTYVITASGLTSDNYNISFVDGEFSITAKTISDGDVTVGTIGDLVYNGQDQTPKPVVKDGTVTLEEGIDYELEYSENKDAGTATITIKGIGNYSGERTVTFKITKASLTITAEDKTKIFGASDPTLTVKYETFVNNETASVLSGTLSISRVAGESVGTYDITASGLTSNNYNISFVDGKFSITAKTISDGDVTVETIEDLVYNGQNQKPKPVVKDGTVTLLEGTDYELEYSENKDAGTATITIKGIGNYRGSRTVTFKITPRTLVVSPDGGLTKKYGETDPVLSYTYQNNVSGETPGFTGSLTRAQGENVGNYEMTRGSLGLVDNGSFKASNYVIELTEDVDFTITKAMLTVRVNDDSKFVTQSDATGYAGVIYTGFKFGENKSVIDESNLVISRTNVGVEAADEYPNVLTATGLLAQNYEFTYDLGDYVIVGADQLLVKLGDREVVYGATPTYGVVYAGYYSSEVNEIVNLTSNSTITNGRVKVVDGVSGSAEFDVTVQSPVNSSSGRLVVDSYKLGGTNIVETSANFKNTVLIQGNLTVIAKELTGGVSSVTDKVYDGNAQLLDLNLTLSTPFAIDVVVLNGTGTYASKDVGTHSYTVSGLTLSGIDSKNYYVSGGASATLTGTGKIAPRTLIVRPRPNQGKQRQTSDPELLFDLDAPLMDGDVLTGALQRESGETVGIYDILLGTLSAGSNYELELVPASFNIYDLNAPVIDSEDTNITKDPTTGAYQTEVKLPEGEQNVGEFTSDKQPVVWTLEPKGDRDDTDLFEMIIDADGNVTVRFKDKSEPGTYVVNLCATDTNGNKTCVTITVIVSDDTAPVIDSEDTNITKDPTTGEYKTEVKLPEGEQNVGEFTSDKQPVVWTLEPKGDRDDTDLFEMIIDADGNVTVRFKDKSEPGTYVVNLCATDPNGNKTCVTITVIVSDDTAPVIDSEDTNITKDPTTGEYKTEVKLPEGEQNVGEFTSDKQPVVWTLEPKGDRDDTDLFEMIIDADGNVTVRFKDKSEPGTYVVNLCATDTNGNKTCVTITVIVSDDTAPVIDSEDTNITKDPTTGEYQTEVKLPEGEQNVGEFTSDKQPVVWTLEPKGDRDDTDLFEMIIDADGNVTVRFKDKSEPGTYVVNLCATDPNGNKTCVTITVIVSDDTAPVIDSEDTNITKDPTTGEYKTEVKLPEGEQNVGEFSSDKQPVVWTLEPKGDRDDTDLFEMIKNSDGSVTVRFKDKSEPGTYVVNLCATDPNGNKTCVTITVIVSDDTAPVIDSEDTNITKDPTTGAYQTEVKLPEGEQNVGEFTSDKQPVVWTLEPKGAKDDTSLFELIKNSDGSVTVRFKDKSEPGTYVVNLCATDPSGNKTCVMITVIVSDDTAPVIDSEDTNITKDPTTGAYQTEVKLPEGEQNVGEFSSDKQPVVWTLEPKGAKDDTSLFELIKNSDGSVTVRFKDKSEPGTYVVNLCATDPSGNKTCVTITVIVSDDTAPVIDSEDTNITKDPTTGAYQTEVKLPEGEQNVGEFTSDKQPVVWTLEPKGAKDDTSLFELIKNSDGSVTVRFKDKSEPGTYVVNLCATDPSGNKTCVTITVIVSDDTAPVIDSEDTNITKDPTTGAYQTEVKLPEGEQNVGEFTSDKQPVVWTLEPKGAKDDTSLFELIKNSDGSVTVRFKDKSEPGTYVVNLCATDPSGNKTCVTITVIVSDDTAPVIDSEDTNITKDPTTGAYQTEVKLPEGEQNVGEFTSDKQPVVWTLEPKGAKDDTSLFELIKNPDGNVTVRFKDKSEPGTYVVNLCATDTSGNKTCVTITVKVDANPIIINLLTDDNDTEELVKDPNTNLSFIEKVIPEGEQKVASFITPNELIWTLEKYGDKDDVPLFELVIESEGDNSSSGRILYQHRTNSFAKRISVVFKEKSKAGVYQVMLSARDLFGNESFIVIKVTVYADVLEAILGAEEIVIEWGSPVVIKAQQLVITSDGETPLLDVELDERPLNRFKRGEYRLTGELILPIYLKNPFDLKADVLVRVLPKPAPEDLLIDNNVFRVEANRIINFIEIGKLTVVDRVDDIHELSLVEGSYDNRFFTIINGKLYWDSADPAAGRDRFKVLVRVVDRDGNVFDKLLEIVRIRPSLSEINIYNSFTPDGDDYNDTWGVPGYRYFKDVTLQVFERSGKRVFHTTTPDNRWDGTFLGKSMPIGSYYWIVEIAETGEVRKGILNLFRKEIE
jgi:gliding motility-associated-like protein